MDDLRINDAEAQISVPIDLLQQIDDILGKKFTSREEFINEALRHRLAHLQYVLPDETSRQQTV